MPDPNQTEAATVYIVDPNEETPQGTPAESNETTAARVADSSAAVKEPPPEERQKIYSGMLESWDIYSTQLSQEETNYNPLGATAERGCANCRWFISPNACIIIEAFPQPITANGLSDRWEAKKVRLGPPLPVVIVEEQEASLTADKATKTEGGIAFPSSDYAVVPDSDKPSEWKLRLAEGSPGNQTVAQIGRAITALQPGGFRGQRVQLSSEEKAGAIRKISGAIGRISGATTDQKENLRERLDAVKSRTLQVTVPNRMVKVVKDLLGRLSLTSDHDDDARPFVLFKDVQGDLRWFAWTTNKWRDRDNPPEILSDKAHRDYVAWVDETQNYPEAWLWHTPGTKWGQADWVEYDNGFLMVSGTVDPGMEHIADALALQKDLGVSHGFRYRHSDATKGIIGWYRTFEISPLPIAAAANPWTSLEVLQKEMDMFTEAKRAFLVDKLGDDEVTRLESDTGALKAALERTGVDWKDVPDADDETPTTQVVNNLNIDEAGMKALADAAGTAAANALIETSAFKDMVTAQADVSTKLKGIADRLDELEKTDDEKIAAAVGGRSHRASGHVASASKGNTLTDDEKEQATKDGGPSILDEIVESMEVSTPAA